MRWVQTSFRILLFILGFALELRVRAATEPNWGGAPARLKLAVQVQQEPSKCLNQQASACAVKTRGDERFLFNLAGSTIVLDRATVVITESTSVIRLVSGAVWVRSRGVFSVRSEFGDASVQQAGEIWVRRTRERMTVSAAENSIQIQPRGASESLLIERGLENFLEGIDASGTAQVGLPKPIDLREHIERWARLYEGSRKSFELEVRRFHSHWSQAVESAASLHRAMYERKVASLNQKRLIEEQSRQREEARNQKLRDLLRRRVFYE